MSSGLIGQGATGRDRLRGIGERLAEGGTIGDLLPVVIAAICFGLVLYALFVAQRKARRSEFDDPGKLFRTLLLDLNLPVRQRDLLRRIARDMQLPDPAVLLIAQAVFREQTHLWLARQTKRQEQLRADLIHLEARLFPEEREQRACPVRDVSDRATGE